MQLLDAHILSMRSKQISASHSSLSTNSENLCSKQSATTCSSALNQKDNFNHKSTLSAPNEKKQKRKSGEGKQIGETGE